MNNSSVTVVGNVVSDVTVRDTGSGTVATFRLASTDRRYDRGRGEWVDGDTIFVNVTCWRALGDNCARSLGKGTPVIVRGRLRQRTVERVFGEERVPTTYTDIEAVSVGPDLARGVAQFERVRTAVAPEPEPVGVPLVDPVDSLALPPRPDPAAQAPAPYPAGRLTGAGLGVARARSHGR